MTRCTMCGRGDAVYVRTYSGEKLCGKCFIESVENKVRVTIARHDMLKPDDKILVAVSGGKDSVTLLHILAKIEREFPEASLWAITVDEGVRGYRDEALAFAVRNCRKLGIEHIVASFKQSYGTSLDEIVRAVGDKKERGGLTPCAYCGVLRRRVLNAAARKMGASKLATGHNLDDETQTMLLNIIHGDAQRLARVKPVLTATHPKLVPRVKPLVEVLEREIALYAYLKRIDFQSAPCLYAKSALRNDVRTMLNRIEEKHAGTKFTILKSIERIAPALEKMTQEVKLKNCRFCGEPTINDVCKPCQMLQELGLA